MPRGDRTGPTGMGPMTGRGAGLCAGFGVPGFANRGPGMGFGRGRGGGGGGGRGWRNMFFATGLTGWQRAAMGGQPPVAAGVAAEQEVETIKQQAAALAQSLDDIRQRIDQLQGHPPQTQQ